MEMQTAVTDAIDALEYDIIAMRDCYIDGKFLATSKLKALKELKGNIENITSKSIQSAVESLNMDLVDVKTIKDKSFINEVITTLYNYDKTKQEKK